MAKHPRGFNFGDRAIWETLRFGTFVSFTNNIPFGTEVYATNRANPVFSVSGWNPVGIACEDWADFTASIGGQYSIFTVQHNMGWSWYPFTTNMATHTGKDDYHSSITLPQVQNYGVGNSAIVGTADQDVVHRFVARCELNNIQPVLYYNIGKNINARGGHIDVPHAAFSSDGTIAAEYPAYCAMVEGRLTELLNDFPDVWLWLDAVGWYPRAYHQSLFNAIRAAGNENNIIIYNYDPVAGSGNGATEVTKPTGTHTDYQGTLDGTQMYVWPFDVASYEYSRVPTNTASEMLVLQSHLKHVYWRGGEVSSPLFVNQWFYQDPAVVGGTPNVLESAATLNARADLATPNSTPFALALSPNGSGVVSSSQKTRVTQVADHIFP